MSSKPVPAMVDPCFDETFYFCVDQIIKQGTVQRFSLLFLVQIPGGLESNLQNTKDSPLVRYIRKVR